MMRDVANGRAIGKARIRAHGVKGSALAPDGAQASSAGNCRALGTGVRAGWLVQHALVAVLWLVGLALPAFGQPTVTVHLRTTQVNAFSDLIRIGDVAEVRGGDARLREQIAHLDLDEFGAAPQVEVTRSQIEYRMRLARIPPMRFQVTGVPRLTVVRRRSIDERQRVEAWIRQQIVDDFRLRPEDVLLQVTERDKQLLSRLGLDPLTARGRAIFPAEFPLGNLVLDIRVEDADGRSEILKLPVSIALMRDLVMTRTNISRGEVITADRVERVRRPVQSRSVQFASYEQVVGHVAQQPLQQFSLVPGTAIDNKVRTSPIVVHRRDRVRVTIHSHGLKVVLLKAEALENGRVGDFIEVMNSKTRKKFTAKIVEAGHVEVEP